MKRIILLVAVTGLGWSCWGQNAGGGGSGQAQQAIFRHHFAGRTAVLAGTNGAKLKSIWSLPVTKAFVDETLGKLARTPYRVWKKELPAEAGDQAALIRPLLQDLLEAESFSEARGPTNSPQMVLAVRLSGERAGLWEKNLEQLLAAWKVGTPREVSVEGATGWEVRLGAPGKVIQLLRVRDWVLMGASTAPGQLLPESLKKLAQGKSLGTGSDQTWLNLEADLAKLGRWLPVFAHDKLPTVELTVVGDGEDVRTRGRVLLPERVAWNYEPWLIPTNRLVDPICSFTIVQGIAPWLRKIPGFAELGWEKMPNQFCSWGLPTLHSQTYWCMPVADGTNTLRRMATRLPAFMDKIFKNPDLKFLYASNNATVFLTGVPYINPHVRSIREAGQDYLAGGLFQLPPKTNPPPASLFQQLQGRKDLAYYDWEITEQRIIHASQIYQLLNLVYKRRLPMESWPSQKWLREIRSKLGNAVTELTVAGPQELRLVRRSHLGLTGFELVSLLRWIESPGFPLTFEPQPPAQLPGPPASREKPWNE